MTPTHLHYPVRSSPEVDRPGLEREGSPAMNETTTAATTWRDTDPTAGAVGRLVLKTDANITVPFKISSAHTQNEPPRVAGFVEGGSDWLMWFVLQDWAFQVEQPPLPTTPGSVIRHDRYGHLVLDEAGQWGNYDTAVVTDLNADRRWTLVHDAGAVES